MSLTDLKKYLNQLPKEQLINELVELYKKFDNVKDHYRSRESGTATREVLEKYRKIIKDEFFPQRGFGKARLSVAKKAISDYKKISQDPYTIADIMLFYVEMGVEYTSEYGDIDERFYYSMESVYSDSLNYIFKNDLEEEFKERCQSVVKNTENTGWGFHDTLFEIYVSYFDV